LPELKDLLKQHNIHMKPHSNKSDIVEVLKKRSILPSNYINGLRRCAAGGRTGGAVPSKSDKLASCVASLLVNLPKAPEVGDKPTTPNPLRGLPPTKRQDAQKVELTDMSDGSVTIYPSLYKIAINS
jgi:hypothetical protein